MYNTESEKRIIRQTEVFLEKLNAPGFDATESLEDLREVLRYHEWKYYVKNEPLISDLEYDLLYKLLEKTETENPLLITPDSPTQRVGQDLSGAFETVDHLVPMLSLANSYNLEDLNNFRDQLKRKLKDEGDIEFNYVAEPKYDGSSIALIYENDLFVRAATRGNGQRGDDITQNVRMLKTVPLRVPFSKYGIHKAELRGEALIRLDAFDRINQQREEKGESLFANPRNAAAGGLRMKDPKEAASRGIELFVYQIGLAEDKDGKNLLQDFKAHSKTLEVLDQLGFRSSFPDHGVFSDLEELYSFLQKWEEKRADYPYEIDGMVIKVNELETQAKTGSTSHHPRWAIAFKFKAKQATSRLLSVEYQVGKVGTITPVAKIQPVALAGVTISSISLHNEEFISSKDLRMGDRVLVERAGDVIPYIVKSLPEFREGDEQPIAFPEYCPVNDTEEKVKLIKAEGEAAWRCPDCVCSRQNLQKMIFFVSKDAMDIAGLGKSLIERFYEQDMLKALPDIYRLDYQRISKMEGFGEKSAANLRDAIENSKNRPLKRLLYALGVHHLGKRASSIIAAQVDSILDLQKWKEEDYLNLKDIGPVLARNMQAFFTEEKHIQLIRELESLGLNIHATDEDRPKEIANPEGPLVGKTILFTGSLQRSNRKEAQKMAEENGAKNISAVSSNLNYLVVGEKAGSKLKKARAIGTVEILTEDEFYELIGK